VRVRRVVELMPARVRCRSIPTFCMCWSNLAAARTFRTAAATIFVAIVPTRADPALGLSAGDTQQLADGVGVRWDVDFGAEETG
jgi:hypothetical protein